MLSKVISKYLFCSRRTLVAEVITNVYVCVDVEHIQLSIYRAEWEAQIGLAIFGVLLTFGL